MKRNSLIARLAQRLHLVYSLRIKSPLLVKGVKTCRAAYMNATCMYIPRILSVSTLRLPWYARVPVKDSYIHMSAILLLYFLMSRHNHVQIANTRNAVRVYYLQDDVPRNTILMYSCARSILL